MGGPVAHGKVPFTEKLFYVVIFGEFLLGLYM
jgi:hypothetical protein